MRLLYYVSDTNVPSWGVGMIYTHVRLLRESGVEAAVLHTKVGFRPRWLGFDTARVYLEAKRFRVRRDDLLVVPEVHVSEAEVLNLTPNRIVFVQASSYVAPGLGNARDYRELGYWGAMATMPHVSEIVERHYGVEAAVIPPCIAPIFFQKGSRAGVRKRQVVLCHKTWCRDFPIVRHTLRHRAGALGWQVVELEDRPHAEVARSFQESALHVNVNCHESFNASVPEAMAAGCVPVCYEAFGGRDFLRDGENAHVFPTHDAYPLVEHVLRLMESWDERKEEVARMRKAGLATARRYREGGTKKALLAYVRKLARRF